MGGKRRATTVAGAIILMAGITACGNPGGSSSSDVRAASASGDDPSKYSDRTKPDRDDKKNEPDFGFNWDKPSCQRWIKADVVALDQAFTYNRWGAFNPIGMMFALRRDVESTDGTPDLKPGKVRLREDKRPRPLVLRANKGDCIKIAFTNLLAPRREDIPNPPDVPFHADLPGNEDLRTDAPATRSASIHIQSLQYLNIFSDGANVGNNVSSLAAPGETREYQFLAASEGQHLLYSGAHLAGGEGDNAALAAGLFGAFNVEPKGSEWYRSQVTAEELKDATVGENADGTPKIDFDAKRNGVPILKMLDDNNELIYSDLNAIIAEYPETELDVTVARDEGVFREFTTILHDEIQVVQAFPELDTDPTLRSVRDGFAINYGADAVGPRLLANRARIGPNADCVECKFEEFFLTSWASGDPAVNIERDEDGKPVRALYPDDPSNVHHAYVGDPVWFRNVHAGPRESHIWHLHSHQWLHSPRDEQSNYQDSESLSPGSGFTAPITFGGGGNRNLTVGDAIFHCHLYPHFAGGMWELWRNHDVFEAGTKDRNLPDGELAKGVPTPALVPLPGRAMPPMPTYKPKQIRLADGQKVWRPALPGYPFFMPAREGHRPPQPPLDMEFDGGLPRHVVVDVDKAKLGKRGDFDVILKEIDLKILNQEGEPDERNAMRFHAGDLEGARPAKTRYGFQAAAYPAFTPEGRRAEFFVNGQEPNHGAPFADPCPQKAPERHYRVSHIQFNMVVNNEGWHDRQARIMALDEDVEDLIAGTASPTPLVMRANSGECLVIHFTNLLPSTLEEDDFQIFTPTDTSGMHVHLVKFDVTSSDGSANGWNYEDGTFAPEEVQERIDAANAAGGALKPKNYKRDEFDRVKLRAERHPRLDDAPKGTQTTIQRWWADPIRDQTGRNRLVGTSFSHDHFSPSSHQQHGLYAGVAVEPKDSTWKDSETGELLGRRDDGGPMPATAVIIPPEEKNAFRELNVAFADFALLYDRRGNPINIPGDELAPLPIAVKNPDRPFVEAISQDDPGGMLLNYRNEPIPLRIGEWRDGRFRQRNDKKGRMENVFRSDIHGDPFTPLIRAYQGDKVVVRLIEGAQEEFHTISMHGLKWLHEYADPDSGFRGSQTFAISQHFELADRLPPQKAKVADYMYKSANSDDLWNGLWGIIRTYRDFQDDLEPVPGNPIRELDLSHPVCPKDAPTRAYTVYAITAKDNLPDDRVTYNEKFQLYDPDAILYVLDKHVDAVISGKRKPEPLVLRANAGDCIDVTLVNALPDELPKTPHWNFFPPIIEKFNINQVRPSNHASLHPQLLEYDIRESDSANVGFNPVQTVAPGESKTYRWYAGHWRLRDEGPVLFPEADGDIELVNGGDGDKPRKFAFIAEPVEYGVVNLRDEADVVNHGMTGGIGALVIEPLGARWKEDKDTDNQATVWYEDNKGRDRKFRELVLLYQDEVGLHSDNPRFQCTAAPIPNQDAEPGGAEARDLRCGTALLPYGGEGDSEDSGHKAFNYRTEPLWARAGLAPQEAFVRLNDVEQEELLDSEDFGDPETPIFEAQVGQEVRFRVLAPSMHSRAKSFGIYGHEWAHEAWALGSDSRVIGMNEDSNIIAVQDAHGPMSHWNIVPIYGAGGAFGVEGDFLFRDMNSVMFPSGMWGLFRVKDE